MSSKIGEFFTNKILIPFRLVPKDGLTPEKIAFSMAIGMVAGVFPVFGMTTVISVLLTMMFRQNLLIVQSVQWILAIIQVMLIIPFMKFGAFMLNQNVVHISMQQINHAFRPGMLSGIKTVGIFHLYGIFSWLILVIPAGVISYYIFLAIFKRRNKAIVLQRDQIDYTVFMND